MKRRELMKTSLAGALVSAGVLRTHPSHAAAKEIVYLATAMDNVFWQLVGKGVAASCTKQGYSCTVLDSRNSGSTQLKNAQEAISREPAGIVLSPSDSGTAGSVLALAKRAGIPVAIADVGADAGDYVTYVHSDNYKGGYGVGEAIAGQFKKKGWHDASYAIISISLARRIGQERTAGFRDGMKAGGFTKEATLQQMQAYTIDETFKYTQDIITSYPDVRCVYIEISDAALGGLNAIRGAKKKDDILLATFDGNRPVFVDYLKSGEVAAIGMQMPFILGQDAADALFTFLGGGKVDKETILPVVVATPDNLASLRPVIQEKVLAQNAG